jgi:putative membrane protein
VITFLWWSITKVGPTRVGADEPVLTARQRNWLIAGVATMWIFSEFPLHQISEDYLFLAHMTQHSVYTMVSSACFLMGAPPWMWKWILANHTVRRIVGFLSTPMVALIVFNAVIAYTHFPAIVGLAARSGLFHFAVHVVLFVTSLFMWVPVINRTSMLPKLKAPTKMIYLFAQSLVPTVPASFLTFAQTPMYEHYANAPRLISFLDARHDQQLAAIIMKLVVGTFIWGIVAYLFYNWWQDSQAGRAEADNMRPTPAEPFSSGVLTFDRVQAEFDRLAVSASASAAPGASGAVPARLPDPQ